MGYGPLTSGLNLIGAGLFLLHLAALLDVCFRPAAAFPAVDKQTKQLWLILLSMLGRVGATSRDERLPADETGTRRGRFMRHRAPARDDDTVTPPRGPMSPAH